MTSVHVGSWQESTQGTMRVVQAEERRVLVCNVAGELYAVDATCSHAGGDLSRGRLDGFELTCPRHGSRFDVRTGACVAPPKIGFLKLKAADIGSYPVRVEGDAVFVDVRG